MWLKKSQNHVIQVVSGLQCDGIPSDSLLLHRASFGEIY